ncbi:mitochondrial acidic protein mam33 [Impatiens glandulifera]|uniref:mitochondrial acidic protein mam33 n=1 Tax=Impatiens glandulifera TaxID=253017 RepID=UPI001FB15CC5|nr:mitochondrial acidic protein mam33 [Impatiens glandulifera]XP_047308828.1 mitochondrial acidic protein mam33 [Impatiens glandulifera]
MARLTTVIRKGRKAVQDLELLKLLRSEINYEHSSDLFQDNEIGTFGDFKLEWDSEQSQDVFLQKKFESGEDIVISAMLDPKLVETTAGRFARKALLKVCITKPGLSSSVLQFDCGLSSNVDNNELKFDIHNAGFIPLATKLNPLTYKGPLFSDLDPSLQEELKNYLLARGISQNLNSFLLFHLHKKEQVQYVNWLRKLEAILAQDV